MKNKSTSIFKIREVINILGLIKKKHKSESKLKQKVEVKVFILLNVHTKEKVTLIFMVAHLQIY